MVEASESPRTGGIRLGVLASGRGSNLQALLDAEARGDLGARISVVISDRAEAPALERARRHGVAAIYLDPGSNRVRLAPAAEERILAHLREHEANWVVLAGFFRIIGSVLLGAYPNRILNIHPSLLPAFPGLHAQKQALDYGVKLAGCTVHLVNASVDQGPILLQATVPVLSEDDEASLSERILREEHRILVEAVRRLAGGGFTLEGRVAHWTSGGG